MTKTYAVLFEGIASTVFHVKDRMKCVVMNSRAGERLISRPMAAQEFQRVRAYVRWHGQAKFKLDSINFHS